MHASIDNFSRRILAWRVADTSAAVNSVTVLLDAIGGATRWASVPVVHEYNHVLPHSAFRGQTPDEMYFGTGTLWQRT